MLIQRATKGPAVSVQEGLPLAEAIDKRFHFLFAVFMAGGNATIFDSLKEAIGCREDVGSSWLPMEMYPKDFIVKLPPFSLNGTCANSYVTHKRIRAMEKRGIKFDAAFYFQHTIVTLLYGLRRRVPYLLAMDGTPLWYAKNGFWYAHPFFEPQRTIPRIKRLITRSVYAHAFHLLPLSNTVKKSLMEDYEIAEERITVVPPGINLRRWIGPQRPPRRAVTETNPLRVLFVGADFLRKGGDLLLSVASRPEFKNVEIHFVTKSFTGIRSENVFVHPNLTINSEELINLYRTADLFVLPTRADSHSIASLEAMAMGLPVIATNVGGIPDIILDGETGYMIKPDDAEALADRLTRFVSHPETIGEMGTKCRKRVESHFNLQTNAERIVELLTKAATDRHNGVS